MNDIAYMNIIDSKLFAYYLFQRKKPLTEIFSLIASVAPPAKHTVFVFDVGKSRHRLEILPSYKSGREQTRSKETPAQKKAKEDFFRPYYDGTLASIIRAMGHKALLVDGVEADDLASILVGKTGTARVNLITSDKDWYQLLREGVTLYSAEGQKYTSEMFKAEYHSTAMFLIYKALMGDDGDSIDGLYRFGPAASMKAVNRFIEVLNETGKGELADVAQAVRDTCKKITLPQGVDTLEEMIERNLVLVETLTHADKLSESERAMLRLNWSFEQKRDVEKVRNLWLMSFGHIPNLSIETLQHFGLLDGWYG